MFSLVLFCINPKFKGCDCRAANVECTPDKKINSLTWNRLLNWVSMIFAFKAFKFAFQRGGVVAHGILFSLVAIFFHKLWVRGEQRKSSVSKHHSWWMLSRHNLAHVKLLPNFSLFNHLCGIHSPYNLWTMLCIGYVKIIVLLDFPHCFHCTNRCTMKRVLIILSLGFIKHHRCTV